MRKFFLVSLCMLCIANSVHLFGQKAATLPLTEVSLFSSGVGYFEHSGYITGDTVLDFDFPENTVNDVLKSLVIIDSETKNPSVTYAAENTLEKTLKSLKIDLSETPDISTLLSSLRGTEVELFVPEKITGIILGTEMRPSVTPGVFDTYVSINGSLGIQTFKISEIASFKFTDPEIGKDLQRALELLRASGSSSSRSVQVHLPGKGKRFVTIVYVIESPVWKATYRLDLSGESPLLQGWAIVDNTGDLDWNNISLSFLNGKPVSFIQNLYAPYFVERPILPLAIAGTAQAAVWTSGYGGSNDAEMVSEQEIDEAYYSRAAPVSMQMKKASLEDMKTQTTQAEVAGAMFRFTVKTPVTVLRQHSTMLPLVQERIKAEKISVFSGEKARNGGEIHPLLCALLTNTSGMKLPAGPITVLDGGTYAGDALLDFFPENEKRIIGFGEDLSVRGSIETDVKRETVSVKIQKGVMAISRKNIYNTTYVISNKGTENKTLFLEHPVRQGASLSLPIQYEERTSLVYRFRTSVAGGTDIRFSVEENEPALERVVLSQRNIENLISYTTSREIPAKVQRVLEKAISLKKTVDEQEEICSDLESQKNTQTDLQERIRLNLAATGNDSLQGRDYLLRLSSSDAEIDRLEARITTERRKLTEKKKDYEVYISTLTIE
ncbi:MAG TPA: hypothetical protein VJ861_02780 [Treponemataceae bacterium]|nr:hypothetical protein [Treponemataceae bacterium]